MYLVSKLSEREDGSVREEVKVFHASLDCSEVACLICPRFLKFKVGRPVAPSSEFL